MDAFDRLVAIMARLRAPEGCPWDREQDHQSLKPYLLEEAYELLEAVDHGDPAKVCAELGDVLLQVIFHAQVAAEAGDFTIAEVCDRISEKLEYRHPHVFGTVAVRDSDEVVDNWEALKRHEPDTGPRHSALDGVPGALPALQRAQKLQRKAARVGFDWPDIQGPLDKVEEELAELHAERDEADARKLTWELGDLLFAIVNLARFLQVDAEDALRQASGRFEARFRQVEQQATEAGRELSQMTLAEMDELWEAAKRSEAHEA